MCAGLAQLPVVPEACLAAQLATNYGFTPLVTSLGMSYLARLARQDPLLLAAGLASSDFAPYLGAIKSCDHRTNSLGLARLACSTAKSWLICLQVYVLQALYNFDP